MRHFIQAVLCSAKIKTQQFSICLPRNVLGFLLTRGGGGGWGEGSPGEGGKGGFEEKYLFG